MTVARDNGDPVKRALSAVFLVASLAYPFASQAADDALARLLGAKSIRCELDRGTQAAWDGGKLSLEPSRFGESGRVTFGSIDAKAGTARIVGTVGKGDVQVLIARTGMTFVERTPSGINFTTVFAAYQSPGSQRFVAVSSRHLDLYGPIPSQFHGTCTVVE